MVSSRNERTHGRLVIVGEINQRGPDSICARHYRCSVASCPNPIDHHRVPTPAAKRGLHCRCIGASGIARRRCRQGTEEPANNRRGSFTDDIPGNVRCECRFRPSPRFGIAANHFDGGAQFRRPPQEVCRVNQRAIIQKQAWRLGCQPENLKTCRTIAVALPHLTSGGPCRPISWPAILTGSADRERLGRHRHGEGTGFRIMRDDGPGHAA